MILRGYVSGAGAKSEEEEEEEEGLRPTRLRPSLLVRRGAGTPTASHKTIFLTELSTLPSFSPSLSFCFIFFVC